ncbi:MAG: HNH endonuclease [Microgenomates group bacterium]
MPLSKGGAHTYINVQTACHACNTKKGNKAGGQMLLFAMV